MVVRKPIKIVIIGAGGFGKEVLCTLLEQNKISETFEILGFIDDDTKLHGKIIQQKKVLGGLDWFEGSLFIHWTAGLFQEQINDIVDDGGDQCRNRNGQDPGPHQVKGNAPANG